MESNRTGIKIREPSSTDASSEQNLRNSSIMSVKHWLCVECGSDCSDKEEGHVHHGTKKREEEVGQSELETVVEVEITELGNKENDLSEHLLSK